MCSSVAVVLTCKVSDRVQIPTAAGLPLKRNKTLLICVGGLAGVCLLFPSQPSLASSCY